MSETLTGSFFDHFATLKDPRVKRSQLHAFGDILFIAVCATIAGADSFTGMEAFGHEKLDWLKQFIVLTHGVPSHDTFRNVFCKIPHVQFVACFASWVKTLNLDLDGKIVAIDGKTARGSGSAAEGKKALHMVSAWASETNLVLGQVATAEKSNEITAIPLLLKQLELQGAIVTIDAMGCQTEIAKQIREQGGHYILPVTGNQKHTEEDVMNAFAKMDEATPKERAQQGVDVHETEEKGHGREDFRRIETMPAPKTMRNFDEWKDLAKICRVTRCYIEKGVEKSDVRYFITSAGGCARSMASWVRGHWGVEMGLHWVLDVCFGDDNSRARTGDAAKNLTTLRSWVLSLLRQAKLSKLGMRLLRQTLGWNDAKLASVLGIG